MIHSILSAVFLVLLVVVFFTHGFLAASEAKKAGASNLETLFAFVIGTSEEMMSLSKVVVLLGAAYLMMYVLYQSI